MYIHSAASGSNAPALQASGNSTIRRPSTMRSVTSGRGGDPRFLAGISEASEHRPRACRLPLFEWHHHERLRLTERGDVAGELTAKLRVIAAGRRICAQIPRHAAKA